MAKKSVNFIKEHLPLIFIVIVILIGLYLLYLNSLQKSNMEKFYLRENFYQNSPLSNSAKIIPFNKDTLYIYAPQREIVSCSAISKVLKEGGNIPDNLPIAGLPNFNFSKYNSSNGFSKSIGLPEPTTVHGKLLDYVMSMLTSIDNIKYYTTDNSNSTTEPVTNSPYYYNKTARGSIPDTDFIEIMKDFFKILTACNNNTTVRFIRYYKKNTASIDCNGKRHFDEIEEKDLAKEINNNNVMIFYENINIINFLQVSNPSLFSKYSKYNDGIFKIKFQDPTGITDQS